MNRLLHRIAFATGLLCFSAIAVRALTTDHPVSTQSLFLDHQRFEVHVDWHTATASGIGFPEALTDNSGYFWFFDATNPELLVKVIDGRAVNGHFWVFLGGLSDVDYTVTITDAFTRTARAYTNPHGTVASRADTTAFADSPEP